MAVRRVCIALLYGLIFFTLPSVCLAQQTASSFTGNSCSGDKSTVDRSVTDAQSASIPGVQVTLTCGQTVVTGTTDGSGMVHFDVSAGSYALQAQASGFDAKGVKLQIIASAGSQHFDVTMNVQGHNESVTVSASNGTLVSATDIGTRTDTALRDVPQSLQIVSKQVLDQQQARSMNDVLRNVAGVTIPWTSGGRYLLPFKVILSFSYQRMKMSLPSMFRFRLTSTSMWIGNQESRWTLL